MSLLATGKKILTKEAFELYEMRLEDVQVEKIWFRNHFQNLADNLYEIEKTKTFSDLVRKLEEGCFANLYYYREEGEEHLKSFFQELSESI